MRTCGSPTLHFVMCRFSFPVGRKQAPNKQSFGFRSVLLLSTHGFQSWHEAFFPFLVVARRETSWEGVSAVFISCLFLSRCDHRRSHHCCHCRRCLRCRPSAFAAVSPLRTYCYRHDLALSAVLTQHVSTLLTGHGRASKWFVGRWSPLATRDGGGVVDTCARDSCGFWCFFA